jgi:hypothetical protein
MIEAMAADLAENNSLGATLMTLPFAAQAD